MFPGPGLQSAPVSVPAGEAAHQPLEVAREVIEEMEKNANERKVTWAVPTSLPAYGDPRLIRIVLENLTNLEQLPPTDTTLIIGILRLRGGSGVPAAVMALMP